MKMSLDDYLGKASYIKSSEFDSLMIVHFVSKSEFCFTLGE